MNRRIFVELAQRGLRMPIGTHLVLHEHADPETLVLDGRRLADVVIETAERFHTPLALPLMDLSLEKAALLNALGIAESSDSFHFDSPPPRPTELALTPRMRATCDAIAYVAKRADLVAMGMAIGPFSLTTKLLADPITPVFNLSSGVTASEEPDVAILEAAIAVAERMVSWYVDAQIDAGAAAIVLCEPAANVVYFSPRQLAQSYATFDALVMQPLQRVVARLNARGVPLVFHDCGELTNGMVERFAGLGAAMLSFGSSRVLWEDAARVPRDTVLYGNLPTKQFYAQQLTKEDVDRLARELLERMAATGHPFILGSECDILSVPGKEADILRKVDAFLQCGCSPAQSSPGRQT